MGQLSFGYFSLLDREHNSLELRNYVSVSHRLLAGGESCQSKLKTA